MKSAMRSMVLVASIAVLTALAAVPPASAGGQASVVLDPVGDLATPAGEGQTGQSYQDITRTEITKRGGTFHFDMDVAAPIPERPPLDAESGRQIIYWVWGMSMTPDSPAGYPRPPGMSGPAEAEVILVWDGERFSMIFIDRRPLLTGGDAMVFPLPFTIRGSHIATEADADLLGNPSAFIWLSLTAARSAEFGNDARFQFDIAPDAGLAGPATWPG